MSASPIEFKIDSGFNFYEPNPEIVIPTPLFVHPMYMSGGHKIKTYPEAIADFYWVDTEWYLFIACDKDGVNCALSSDIESVEDMFNNHGNVITYLCKVNPGYSKLEYKNSISKGKYREVPLTRLIGMNKINILAIIDVTSSNEKVNNNLMKDFIGWPNSVEDKSDK